MAKQVIFDVDGVFLSEERCFDSTALTIHELLYADAYCGLDDSAVKVELEDVEIYNIRKTILREDQLLNALKDKGLNSNWDMLFIIFSLHLIHMIKAQPIEEDHFDHIDRQWLMAHDFDHAAVSTDAVYEFLITVPEGKTAVYDALVKYAADELNTAHVAAFELKSELWMLAQHVFQEWYLGEHYLLETTRKRSIVTGKKGFLEDEEILADQLEIKQLLKDLKAAGYTLAIATGRPRIETLVPFKALGLLEEFDEHKIVTATEVLEAEERYPGHKPLGKPNPFSYIAAFEGNDEARYLDYIEHQDNRVTKEVIVVGDSLADYYCARTMGAYFTATLTGLKGQSERSTFQALEADAIIDDILGLRTLLLAETSA